MVIIQEINETLERMNCMLDRHKMSECHQLT